MIAFSEIDDNNDQNYSQLLEYIYEQVNNMRIFLL